MVAPSCSPSYLGDSGRRIPQAQEVKATVTEQEGDRARGALSQKKNPKNNKTKKKKKIALKVLRKEKEYDK